MDNKVTVNLDVLLTNIDEELVHVSVLLPVPS